MDTGNIIDLARERRRRGPRFDGGLMEILEVSRDLVCLCRGGNIKAINGAGVRLLGGTTTEDMLGRRLTDFLVPDNASVIALFLAGKASEDKAVPTRLLGLDGGVREVEMQVYRAREIAPDATVIVCRDLSNDEIPAGKTQEADARFSMLVEHSMNLVCRVLDGRIRYVNSAGMKLLGAESPDAVCGLCVTDIFHDDYAEVFAADTLVSLVAESTGIPMRLKRLDGMPVDVHVMVSHLPTNRGVELMVEARDITAHNRAVMALRAANETLEMRVAQRTRELAEQRRLAEESKSVADASRRFTESLLDMIPGPVWFRDARGRIQSCNRAFRDLFGDAPLPAEDIDTDAGLLAGTLDHVTFEAAFERADSPAHHLLFSKCAYLDDEGHSVGILGVVSDISERKAMERELRRLATTDPLTGAANRRQFLLAANAEWKRSGRAGREMAVVMLDIDHFKRINDSFGHAVGDEALRAFVASVQACLRESDLLARMGGEEFAVLLPDTDAEGALEAAERLRSAVASVRVPTDGGAELSFTSSLGVASLSGTDAPLDDLLQRADQALYRAKHNGRNRVETG